MTRVPIDQVFGEIRRTLRRGDTVRAVQVVREFARQAGQDPRARLAQGMLAIEFGQGAEAVRVLEQLTFELMGDDQKLATILLARGRLLDHDPEGALRTIEPVCEADDAPGTAIGVKAEALVLAGRPQDAEAVLDAAPADAPEPHGLAMARAVLAFETPAGVPELAAREDRAIEALTAERERVGVPAPALADICLALGELKARRGDDAGAATLFRRSVSLNPTRVDVRPYAQTVMQLNKGWTGSALKRAQRNKDELASAARLLFVVGMPGGGPELVSELLQAAEGVRVNPQPEALTWTAGRFLSKSQGDPLVFDPSKISGKQLTEAANAYLGWASPGSEGSDLIVDAHALNMHVLGVTAQLFPNARVVFVRRDPFDACLGCMMRHRDPRLLYANDPRAAVVFAEGMRRLAALWGDVFAGEHLPLETLTLDYADLTNGADAARSLYEFAGLESPADDTVSNTLAAHTRWTTHRVGLADRFGELMPELTEAVQASQLGPA